MSNISTTGQYTKTMLVGAVSHKKISLISMMAVCVGLVIVQGAMISSIQGMAAGGLGFILAMLIALVIAQFNAMSFAELSLMFPQEGTLATYTQKAIGHFPAIVAVFSGYVVVGMLSLPVELFLVDVMIHQLLPNMFPDKMVPVLIVIVLAATNLVGADVFSKVQNILAFVMVSALVITGAVALSSAHDLPVSTSGPSVDWGLASIMDGSFIGLITLAIWLFVGVEFICPMINEVKDPVRNIPRAMRWSLIAIFIIFTAFVYGASLFLDKETLLGSTIPYLDYANAVFGQAGLTIATIMALAATCSTVNTILASLPRMLHGMALNKQAFPQLKAVNRFGVPWVGTVMMAVLVLIPFFAMEVDSLIVLVIAATTSYLLAYVVAHINVLVLRRRMPGHQRPYRTPFYPLPQIVGILAMLFVMFNNSPSPEMTQLVYVISGGMLLVIGLIAAIWVKFYMKRGLFEPDLE